MATNKQRVPEIPEHLSIRFFLNICNTALNETAPPKQKYANTNNIPFMNKTFLKAIIKQTKTFKNIDVK